jgi:hypothetical protein
MKNQTLVIGVAILVLVMVLSLMLLLYAKEGEAPFRGVGPGHANHSAVTPHSSFGLSGYSNKASAASDSNYPYLPETPEIYPEPEGFTNNEYLVIIALDDVNGDSYLDVAGAINYGDWYSNYIFWNDGPGIFNDYICWGYGNEYPARDYAFGDMSGDGNKDLAIAHNRIVEVHLNESKQLSPSYAWWDTTCGWEVAWGDVNNDGWLDLAAVRRKGYGGVAVYLNNNQDSCLSNNSYWTTPYWGCVGWGLKDGPGDNFPELAIGSDNDILIFPIVLVISRLPPPRLSPQGRKFPLLSGGI